MVWYGGVVGGAVGVLLWAWYRDFLWLALLDLAAPALERREKVKAKLDIRNTNRVVGKILGSEVTRRYGPQGLPEVRLRRCPAADADAHRFAAVPAGAPAPAVAGFLESLDRRLGLS